ncbi:hypothetical protein GE118_01045 [Mycoplasma sp. NEAQ87857]|uniref:hypothetical protein n=1 Tax=Mycoplasma sp. NEAQ87857 TaxID=2683967 RepID=UPI0013190605|nr:hypothetical protein [Mycoplasma sp. NEAQ87857]QGZ97379.1 hypothetical protein GE118_01045 [Mycoplasma sp. NEAQ87857]
MYQIKNINKIFNIDINHWNKYKTCYKYYYHIKELDTTVFNDRDLANWIVSTHFNEIFHLTNNQISICFRITRLNINTNNVSIFIKTFYLDKDTLYLNNQNNQAYSFKVEKMSNFMIEHYFELLIQNEFHCWLPVKDWLQNNNLKLLVFDKINNKTIIKDYFQIFNYQERNLDNSLIKNKLIKMNLELIEVYEYRKVMSYDILNFSILDQKILNINQFKKMIISLFELNQYLNQILINEELLFEQFYNDNYSYLIQAANSCSKSHKMPKHKKDLLNKLSNHLYFDINLIKQVNHKYDFYSIIRYCKIFFNNSIELNEHNINLLINGLNKIKNSNNKTYIKIQKHLAWFKMN